MASNTNPADLKPGSSREDAAKLSGKSDFGVHESDVRGRTYTSENTKAADHGHAQPNSFEHLGDRTSGAGARDNGRGSGSGGDIDPDFIGLDGAGLSTNIDKQAPRTAADTDGSSNNAASGGPSQTQDRSLVGKVGGPHPQINVVTVPDDRTRNTGADAASNGQESDDSFQAEISSAEASGRDDKGV